MVDSSRADTGESRLAVDFPELNVIVTAAMPMALVSSSAPAKALGPVLEGLDVGEIAESFSWLADCSETLRAELEATGDIHEAVPLALYQTPVLPPEGLFVRFLVPRSSGGYATGLVFGADLAHAIRRMADRAEALAGRA